VKVASRITKDIEQQAHRLFTSDTPPESGHHAEFYVWFSGKVLLALEETAMSRLSPSHAGAQHNTAAHSTTFDDSVPHTADHRAACDKRDGPPYNVNMPCNASTVSEAQSFTFEPQTETGEVKQSSDRVSNGYDAPERDD
jgi:hypothetical protein